MSFEEWWERESNGNPYGDAYDFAKAAWETAYQNALVEIWKRQAEERKDDGEKAQSARG